jgi:two-component system chemotaxis response regulator CheB
MPVPTSPRLTTRLHDDIQAICIGVSTGGPVALQTVIPALPSSLPVPVFIVQHMPPVFTKSLAEQLDRVSHLRVVEASDGLKAQAGHVYIAPGGYQMKLEGYASQVTIRINQDPPVNNARPSVNYLFHSAVQCYGGKLAVAILTGMGNDGLSGCESVKRAGGRIIAQDPETSVVYGMPRCVNEAGLSEATLPLGEIAAMLVRLAGQGAALCR